MKHKLIPYFFAIALCLFAVLSVAKPVEPQINSEELPVAPIDLNQPAGRNGLSESTLEDDYQSILNQGKGSIEKASTPNDGFYLFEHLFD